MPKKVTAVSVQHSFPVRNPHMSRVHVQGGFGRNRSRAPSSGRGVHQANATANLRRTQERTDGLFKAKFVAIKKDIKFTFKLNERKIHVYNCYSGAFGKELDMTGDEENRVNQSYAALKNLIAPASQIFTVNVSKRTYSVDGGKIQNFNLSDPTCMQLFSELAGNVQPVWGGNLRVAPEGMESKSPNPVPPPLERSNPVLQSLPMDYKGSALKALEIYAASERDPTKQETAMKRVMAAEKIVNSQKAKINAKLNQLRGVQPQTQDILRSTIELEEIKAKLEMDRLAMYLAAAFYPTNANPSFAEVTAAAKKVRDGLQTVINQVRAAHRKKEGWRTRLPTVIPTPIRAEKSSISPNGAYCQGVADLLFAPHDLMPKDDSNEESLIKSLVSFIADGARGNVTAMETLLGTITDATIKAECLQDLTNAMAQAQSILNGPALLVPPGAPTLAQKINHLQDNVFQFQ